MQCSQQSLGCFTHFFYSFFPPANAQRKRTIFYGFYFLLFFYCSSIWPKTTSILSSQRKWFVSSFCFCFFFSTPIWIDNTNAAQFTSRAEDERTRMRWYTIDDWIVEWTFWCWMGFEWSEFEWKIKWMKPSGVSSDSMGISQGTECCLDVVSPFDRFRSFVWLCDRGFVRIRPTGVYGKNRTSWR